MLMQTPIPISYALYSMFMSPLLPNTVFDSPRRLIGFNLNQPPARHVGNAEGVDSILAALNAASAFANSSSANHAPLPIIHGVGRPKHLRLFPCETTSRVALP